MSTQTIFKTAGATSRHVDVQLVQKASATSPGDPITALAFNTASLTAYFRKGATGAVTVITLATQTVTGAWSSGGFVELDSTHAPGGYRFDIPDTCLTTAGECNIWFTGAASLATHMLKIIIEAVDMFSSANVPANVTQQGGVAIAPRYTGTALAGAASTITLAAGTTALQCIPGDSIRLTGGTGSGQVGPVTAFNAATGVATIFDAWPVTIPSTDTTYEILKAGGGIPATPADMWGDTDAPTRILTAATNLTSDGTVVARESTVAAVKAKTDNLPASPADETLVIAATTALSNKLGTPAGASVSADIAAVKADTGTLATNYTGTRAGKLDHLDVDVSTRIAPTTAGRTLDISATGEAGVDWANVGGQATVVNLSNTAIASGGGGGTDLTPVLTAVASVQADTTTLTGRLSSARATKLDNLDATVTSRLAPTVAARTLDVSAGGEAGIDLANVGSPTTVVALSGVTIKTATDIGTTLGTPAGASVSADVAALSTKLGTPSGASVSADVAAIKTDTGNVSTRLTSTRAGYLDNLSSGAAALETSVQAVKAKTDNLPAAPADETLIIAATTAISNKLGTPAVTVSADIAAVQTRLGAPVGASISADVAGVRSDTTKIGNPAGASVSADVAAIKTDSGNVATRLTSARAGYLDNLSAGAAALEASVQSVKTKTDALPPDPADASDVLSATNAIFGRLGAPTGASVSADIAGVQTKLGTPAGASVSVDVAAIKTDTTAVKVKTDNLPAAPADETLIINATNAIMTRLGAPAGSSTAADIAAIKGVLPTALVGGRMDSDVGNMRTAVITSAAIADAALTAAKAATGFIGAAQLGSDAANEIRDAIFTQIIEGTVTFIQSVRGQNRSLFAKVSGVQNNRPVFRDLADTKDSIVAVVDNFGNRTSVAADLT